MPDLAKYYDLLVLCARAQTNLAHYDRLREAVDALPSWEPLPHLAEIHGLAPLVYTHLQAANIPIPEAIERELRARAMQHTHANRVRSRALAQILAFFGEAGIDLLVLKGMAMAHLVYPRPGLRPMSDIDLLVSQANAERGQALLAELGFCPVNTSGPPSPHHKPILQRQVEGVNVYVELHHNLNRKLLPETGFEALRPAAITFMIENVPAYTLSHADLLAHTYSHMVGAPFQSFRLIWIADMVSLVERFGDELDWDQLPLRVYNALATINWLTPFRLPRSERVYLTAPTLPYQKAAQLRGWPFNVTPAQNESEYASNIPKAFRPSSWWLRLYYGLEPDHPLVWACVQHPFRLLWWVARFRNPAHIFGRVKNIVSFQAHNK
ncbi:MAG: nucleotidyltransferase family protein [Chloroflexota bacterium]|nr:nucleotidyltransferase family protein [Chloroflexota bacterium]